MVKKYFLPGLLTLIAVVMAAVLIGTWELQQPARFKVSPEKVSYIEWRYYTDASYHESLHSVELPSKWSENIDYVITDQEDIKLVCSTLANLYLEEYPNPLDGEPKWRAYAISNTYQNCFVFHLNNGSIIYFRWGDTMVNFDNHWGFAVSGEETGYVPIYELFEDMRLRLIKEKKAAETTN